MKLWKKPTPVEATPSPAAKKPETIAPTPKTKPSLSKKPEGSDAFRGRIATLPPADVDLLNDYEGEVPTADGGSIAVTDRQRVHAAYLTGPFKTTDGGILYSVLLVDRDEAIRAEIMEVREAIRRNGRSVSVEFGVDLEVIRKVHESSARRQKNVKVRTGGEITQKNQQRVLDIVNRASATNCSDIHLNVGRYEARLRVREDGSLVRREQMSSDIATELCMAAFNMADSSSSDPTYKALDYQGARISGLKSGASLPKGVQSIRLQFSPLSNAGRYLVMRLLYESSLSETGDVAKLGYAPIHVRHIERIQRKPFGCCIISGPTGSGKSTTLQRVLLGLMALKPGENVITVEDPPEYIIPGAAQVPVTNVSNDEDRSTAFGKAIRAVLRMDPDIIMIGEIRDRASSDLAFQAAMTGHQVYASLHANDATSIPDRLRDQGIELYKVADHGLLTGLIGQRLIRKLCPHCKIAFCEGGRSQLRADMADEVVRVSGDRLDQVYVGREGGCSQCREKGYMGREVIAEVLVTDSGYMKFVQKGEKEAGIQYWLREREGMTMLEHAVQKMAQGLVDPRDVEGRAGEIGGVETERLPKIFGGLLV